ncbi:MULTISPECIES: hypothetical protein [Amycolatopsis]|uniref:hypothetical protein n=1 Tax=Amycolatopsis TaxID=1813 RepID=UPI003977765B
MPDAVVIGGGQAGLASVHAVPVGSSPSCSRPVTNRSGPGRTTSAYLARRLLTR